MQVEKKLIYCKVLLLTIILSPYRLSRMVFFSQLFNGFQLFFCEKEILKIAGHSQNRSKILFERVYR
jgi:hypothetical protein